MKSIKYFIQYIFFRIFVGFFAALPLAWASRIAAGLGAFLASLPISVNSVARKNIRLAFPQKTEQEVRHIQLKATQNFMQTILEMPALYKLNKKNFARHIKVVGFENFSHDPSQFILTAHLGNWETINKTIGLKGLAIASIYRRANNPFVDAYVKKIRTQQQGLMIPKGTGGARKLVKAIKGGMAAGFLNDQKMSDGIESTFFGQEVKSPSSIAELALKYNRSICPVFCKRTGYGQFNLTFEKPISIEGQAPKQAIQTLNNLLEERIRQNPEEWLWHHKRF